MGFLAAIFSLILKWWQGRGPSPIVVESEKAGTSQAEAASTEKSLNEVSAARIASDAALANGVRDPATLRAADPDSRD